MLKLRQHVNFAVKSLEKMIRMMRRAEMVEHFECHRCMVPLPIARAVHDAHATSAGYALDREPVCEDSSGR
ncbi:hypothetical protein LVJ94_48980 [Pendulispora rubella]|uniref:Uncharacterized protein n=1 Tax=Pendulispora rubella TaxID=2741070 RepID=A0ABZ2L4T4_9BACT